ncbi:MAG: hypothetical protein DI629_20075 [Mesorhizobium amorphae]|nr:MAG: hypothetical protein DI629_20075 [Mesorhizobium amorphae]
MSLKIKETTVDSKTGVRLSGLFDGELFTLALKGAEWLFRTASGRTVSHPAHDGFSSSEASGALWASVARVREAQKAERAALAA